MLFTEANPIPRSHHRQFFTSSPKRRFEVKRKGRSDSFVETYHRFGYEDEAYLQMDVVDCPGKENEDIVLVSIDERKKFRTQDESGKRNRINSPVTTKLNVGTEASRRDKKRCDSAY